MLLLIIVGEANASEFPSMNTAFEFYFILISNQLAVAWGGESSATSTYDSSSVCGESSATSSISAAWGRKHVTANIQLQRHSSSAGAHATSKVFPSSATSVHSRQFPLTSTISPLNYDI